MRSNGPPLPLTQLPPHSNSHQPPSNNSSSLSTRATDQTVSQRQILQKFNEIAHLFAIDMDLERMAVLVALCEEGTDPQALAEVIKYLRRL